jgi:hypothetical protein
MGSDFAAAEEPNAAAAAEVLDRREGNEPFSTSSIRTVWRALQQKISLR